MCSDQTMKQPSISPRLLTSLFTSLSSSSTSQQPTLTPTRQWHLHRILRSDNSADINGELNGIATLHPLHRRRNSSLSPPVTTAAAAATGGHTDHDHDHDHRNQHRHRHREMVYKEEGEMPSSIRGMAGLKWTKKYIWRLNDDVASSENDLNLPNQSKNQSSAQPDTATSTEETEMTNADVNGGISVWFVKIKPSRGARTTSTNTTNPAEEEDEEDEPDYLFHEFNFNHANRARQNLNVNSASDTASTQKPVFDPPSPPPLVSPALLERYPRTTVISATGDHLCVKDMYYTAYSFRIVPESGEVVSWASRHVVKGPKKNQDILNLYSMQ